MSRTYPVLVDDDGRIALPVVVRDRLGLHSGSSMLLLETPRGLVLATREQVKQLVREALTGPSLVDELVLERQAEAAADR